MIATYPCELDLFVYLREFLHLISQLVARRVPLGPEQQRNALIGRRLL